MEIAKRPLLPSEQQISELQLENKRLRQRLFLATDRDPAVVRDGFAMAVATALTTRWTVFGANEDMLKLARLCYRFADQAMIARNEPPSEA